MKNISHFHAETLFLQGAQLRVKKSKPIHRKSCHKKQQNQFHMILLKAF